MFSVKVKRNLGCLVSRRNQEAVSGRWGDFACCTASQANTLSLTSSRKCDRRWHVFWSSCSVVSSALIFCCIFIDHKKQGVHVSAYNYQNWWEEENATATHWRFPPLPFNLLHSPSCSILAFFPSLSNLYSSFDLLWILPSTSPFLQGHLSCYIILHQHSYGRSRTSSHLCLCQKAD